MTRTWNAAVAVRAQPDRVLDALTDPDACARWSGLAFAVDDDPGTHLRSGSRAHVSGRIAGRSAGFDVEIHRADTQRLVLCATGPVRLDADYTLRPVRGGCVVEASISVAARGPFGLPTAGATAALLASGALRRALDRLAREAEAAQPSLAA
jgi:uncharacterized protein YndB with AHSA1/START domain